MAFTALRRLPSSSSSFSAYPFFSTSIAITHFRFTCPSLPFCLFSSQISRRQVQVAALATMAEGSQAHIEDQDNRDRVAGVPGLRYTAWDQQAQRVAYPKIEKDEEADVVVVGAGIAGLSVAYNLVKEGKSVVVLEAKIRGSGQTGRTSAHIMPWNDDYYYKIEKEHGHEVAKLVGDSHRTAIDWVEKTVLEEKIDCEFSRIDGYLFPHEDSPEVLETLIKELEASQRAGFDVKLVDLHKDPALGRIGKAIHFPNSGDFHPLMYINGLAQAIVRNGGRIYEQSRVMSNEGTMVKTKDGVTVKAKAVVLATNSPLNHNLAIHARQTPERSYVVGLKVPKGAIRRAQWWDTYDPYHYVRMELKEDFDVLIVGGEDTSSGMKPADYHDSYGNLERWARERWTSAGEVIYKWTGQVYEPVDFLHIIGPDPGNSDPVFVVTGDSGQGMTGSTIAGILIKDMILGRANSWAEIYSPKRKPPASLSTAKSAGEAVDHTIQGYKNIVPGFGTDIIDIEDLSPGNGAIKQKGLQKLAIYKDNEGNIFKFSAVCPHMKCIVQWNPVDKTFDCPCHGSIFDHHGKCVNGPAKADLSPA